MRRDSSNSDRTVFRVHRYSNRVVFVKNILTIITTCIFLILFFQSYNLDGGYGGSLCLIFLALVLFFRSTLCLSCFQKSIAIALYPSCFILSNEMKKREWQDILWYRETNRNLTRTFKIGMRDGTIYYFHVHYLWNKEVEYNEFKTFRRDLHHVIRTNNHQYPVNKEDKFWNSISSVTSLITVIGCSFFYKNDPVLFHLWFKSIFIFIISVSLLPRFILARKENFMSFRYWKQDWR
ncbi:hypothetical protein K4L44_00975 [Halosquirtibacter laminarini]|uniref:Uncharacterized protein n=1 Tax=Halosquirtibacter laminarini TaxID=3374600 RepID=A0AC61NPN7_9BACT|nr:hypothetical protein K4L44_00975 [Prolixibacteraceae bacterium]